MIPMCRSGQLSLAAFVALFAIAPLLAACPPPSDDDDSTPVAPPDDDDADSCDDDGDCRFQIGLEICSDEGLCVDGDRNNARDEAQLMTYGETVRLHIAPAGDVDWFRFNGDRGDLILIATEADDPTELDTVVVYTDGAGNEIAFNDDFERVGTIPPNSRLYTGVPTNGQFFFSVQDRRSWVNDPSDPPKGGSDFEYDVTLVSALDNTGITAVDQAINDDSSDAVTWDVANFATNYTAGGFLEPSGDHDWIEIAVNAGESLRVYGFPDSGSAGVTQVTVYMPDGVTPIRTYQDLAWGTDDRAWVPVLESGVYYLDVEDADGGGGFDTWYYLHAARDEAEADLLLEAEPNGDDATAQPFVPDFSGGGAHVERLRGRILPAGDQDWIGIAAEAGDRLTMSFEATPHGEPTDPQVSLFDPAGNLELGPVAWDGGEDPVLALIELDVAGTWHLVIEEQDPAQGGGNYFYTTEVRLGRN